MNTLSPAANTVARAVRRPPGPKPARRLFGALGLGVLSPFRKDPPGFLLGSAREFGDIVYLPLARQHGYLINRPEWIRDVLVTHQSNFLKSRILERSKILLGEGLLTSEGEFHTSQRRLVQPAFHRDRMAHYGEAMVACAARARDRWKEGETIDLLSEMPRLTLDIVGRTLFSTDVSSEADRIGRAMTEILGNFDQLLNPFADLLRKLPLPSVRKFEKARATLDEIVYGLIAERRASGRDEGDLLSMLLLAQDEDRGGMTDQQIRDEALTLLIAGHETTANALIWCWYLLSQNPEAEARMQAELAAVLGGRAAEFDDVPKLVYTGGIFAETLRLYPPAWAIGRRAKEDYRVGEYTIPAGSIILLSPWVSHRDARWFAEPEKFDPGRWQSPEIEKLPKFAYFPFGGGARVCIGAEGVLVLATLAQKWKMRRAPGQKVETRALMTLRSRYPMRMVVESCR